VQTTYTLTGESRGYNKKDGVMNGISPDEQVGEGGCGAWELALRYSMLDLNDDQVQGGEVFSTTAGVNWYLNDNARVMFNLNRTKFDGVGEQDAAAVRFQFVF
jgi:phosphate-selective porin OprO/OprP